MTPLTRPFILNPSPGCPHLVSLDQEELGLLAVVASPEPPAGQWSLLPAAANQAEGLAPIRLTQRSRVEIQPNAAPNFRCVRDTRASISKELFLHVLEGQTRFWHVALTLEAADRDQLLRKADGHARPTLYDLCLDGQRKPHAVCLTASEQGGLRFIHLTDLHLARRNDLIGPEIAAAAGATEDFNNFNDRMRQFIRHANAQADRGELDLVLIGGDLVDFVNHGVADEVDPQDNNWHCFLEILTGSGAEPLRGNTGLKAPVFTATGNHDWRLHPYNVSDRPGEYGLSKEAAELFDSFYYDSSEKIDAKTADIYDRIVKPGSPVLKENWYHARLKWLLGYSETWKAKSLIPILMLFFSHVVNMKEKMILAALLAGVLHHGINAAVAYVVRRSIRHGVLAIEADVHALHYYFLHVNPYFNYAFSFGGSRFIMMDSGPDCFTGQQLWDGGDSKMNCLSIRDNIIGGSPDSMAFYPANKYYSYSQITWLEKVMEAIASEQDGSGRQRVFICLHAPPINTKVKPAVPAGRDEILLEKGKVEIRFGTINHFLSQFFYLCLGKKEKDSAYAGPKADIVFAGHAHQQVEFRLAERGGGPLVYSGEYAAGSAGAVFNHLRPFVVQTAACGPRNEDGYPEPPYFRQVHVDRNGTIMQFG